MSYIELIKTIFKRQEKYCNHEPEIKALKEKVSILEQNKADLSLINENLNIDLTNCVYALNEAKNPVPEDYSYIPETWTSIPYDFLITKKYTYNNTAIPQHLTDLLDSSYVSREYASECVLQYKFTKDTPIEEILKKVYNKMIYEIKYVTNQVQYGKIDQWDNGDLALISGKGDCDLSARAFVRVLSDVLHYIDHKFSSKKIFMFYGFFNNGKEKFGHAWCQVNVDGVWYLFELTKDSSVSSLERPNGSYEPYFCHNDRVGWYMNKNWGTFL